MKKVYSPKLGSIGGVKVPSALGHQIDTQFGGRISVLSVATSPIEYFDFDGNILNTFHSTSFFYRKGNRVFLVTALHALTGKDCFTGEFHAGNTKNFEPRKIRIRPFSLDKPLSRMPTIDFELYDRHGAPIFRVDPLFDQLKTDIACIELPSQIDKKIACVNSEDEPKLVASPGADCFVLGYPSNQYHDPLLAIWRKATFAYEPAYPIDGKPIFLLDGMTSSGMSGAPILQRSEGIVHVEGEGGEIEAQLIPNPMFRFIGVYGGRLGNRDQLGELSYGWYANRIDRIIDQSVSSISWKLEPIGK